MTRSVKSSHVHLTQSAWGHVPGMEGLRSHTHGWPMATAVGQPGSMRASAADLRSESLLLEEVRG